MTKGAGATQHSGRFVEANGLRIYYEEFGAGEPLVLVHGGTDTGEAWHAQLPLLTPHFRVLTPDSRGHGRTVNPDDSLSYRTMADDLAAFVGALGLEKPLVYGYSDGGQIALELGMHYPELAQALVVGAAWFTFSAAYRDWVAGFLGGGLSAEIDAQMLERELPGYVEFLRTAHQPADADATWQRLLRQAKAMWLTPLNYTADDFGRIVAPTLVVVGDRDALVPAAEAAEMYRLIPAAELAIVPNADHLTAPESPLLQAAVLDFLLRRRR